MNIFKTLSRFFGFSAQDNDTDYDTEGSASTPYINPFKHEDAQPTRDNTLPACSETELQKSIADADEAVNAAVLEKTIEIINAGLPEFIKQCIDRETEKKYIREAFGNTFSDYFAQLKANIEEKARVRWYSEQSELSKKNAELTKKLNDITERHKELTDRLLSLERQKTALNERAIQAENKAENAESERDKWQVQSQSLNNKLKVAAIDYQNLKTETESLTKTIESKDKTLQQLSEELTVLRAQNEASNADLLTAQQAAEKLDKAALEIETLRKRIAELETATVTDEQTISSQKADIEQLSEELTTLRAQNEASNADLLAAQQAAEKLDKAALEIETLRKRITELETTPIQNNQVITSLQATIKGQTDEIYNLKVERNNLRDENRKLTDKIKSLNEKPAELDNLTMLLDEAKKGNESLTARIEEANRHIRQLKEEIKTRNSEIQSVKQLSDNKDKQINDLEQENQSLNSEITNAKQQYDEENKKQLYEIKVMQEKIALLNAELEEMKSVPATDKAINLVAEESPADKKTQKKRTSKQKRIISAIDYNMDSDDWLLPTPPSQEIPIDPTPAEPDIQETTNKEGNGKTADGPVQMHLF